MIEKAVLSHAAVSTLVHIAFFFFFEIF